MTAPPLPRGIERDDTVHGRMYYTRAQVTQYALDYAEEVLRQRAPRPSSQPSKPGSGSDVVDDLLARMGL